MAHLHRLQEVVAAVLGDKASKMISALGELTIECLPEH